MFRGVPHVLASGQQSVIESSTQNPLGACVRACTHAHGWETLSKVWGQQDATFSWEQWPSKVTCELRFLLICDLNHIWANYILSWNRRRQNIYLEVCSHAEPFPGAVCDADERERSHPDQRTSIVWWLKPIIWYWYLSQYLYHLFLLISPFFAKELHVWILKGTVFLLDTRLF